MKVYDIQNTANQIYTELKNRRLKEALDSIRNWIFTVQLPAYSDTIDELEANYRLMLQYAVDGASDPQRDMVYFGFIRKAFHLADMIREELLVKYSGGYDYTQLRYSTHLPSGLDYFVALLEEQTVNRSLGTLLEEGLSAQGKKLEYARQHEQTRLEMFRQVWLSTEVQTDHFSALLANNSIEEIEKSFAISALTLNLLRVFNEERLGLLMNACQHPDSSVRQHALVGLVVILSHYDYRLPYYDAIGRRLALLSDDSAFVEAIFTIIIQFIRTAETDKISRKMQQEIIPEMMKIAPQLKDKIDLDSMINAEEGEDKNPEWQELIESSGVGEKLREMSELQMEGADVYMNTFAQLKHYPFFNNPANWFLAFDPSHSDIQGLSDGYKSLIKLLVNNSYLCNSDKYSLAISMMQIPELQRNSMVQAFKLESEQYNEIQKEERSLASNVLDKRLSNQYIQDLYRFYKLYPFRTDFIPIFEFSLRFHTRWFFNQLNMTEEQQAQIAEFYFAKEHYAEAFELLNALSRQKVAPNIFQKMGYCRQQAGAFDEALEYYLRAEALEPEQKWLTRKIAYCYKMLRQYDAALDYYRRAEALEPESRNLQLQIGHLLVQRKHYPEALNYYFKVELAASNPKVWRAIAWCSFLSEKFKQAENYYAKIIEQNPTKLDLLNAGHVAWALQKRVIALEFYARSLQLFRNEDENFFEAFDMDVAQLKMAGIPQEEIPLMMDRLRYMQNL
jgi:tetratricopeptide (TPR) repeat protein